MRCEFLMIADRMNLNLSLVIKKAVALIYIAQAAIKKIAKMCPSRDNAIFSTAVFWHKQASNLRGILRQPAVVRPKAAMAVIVVQKAMASA